MPKLSDIDLVNYVVNKGATLKEAADYFEVSLSTVKKTMRRIKEELSKESEIYKDLNNVAQKNELLGKIKGGQSTNSGSERSYSLEEVSLLAIQVIASNMTLDLASENFKIPKSTLWDNFKRLNCEEYQEIYNDLVYIYDCHNKGIGNSVILDVEKRSNNHEQWLESLKHAEDIKLESVIQKYNLKLDEIKQHKNK